MGKNKGLPKWKNPPAEPERNTWLPEPAETNLTWDVKITESPEEAVLYVNATGIEPRFVYSSGAGKTVVWYQKPSL